MANYPGNGQRGNNRDYQKNNHYAPPRTNTIEALQIPADYIDEAERIMGQCYRKITTSKIRRLYSMTTEIYNVENLRTEKTLTSESEAAIGMMRIHFAYESGRDPAVADFVRVTKLMSYLKGIGSREAFIRFARYMEALVAYHKYFGGRE